MLRTLPDRIHVVSYKESKCGDYVMGPPINLVVKEMSGSDYY